MFLQKNKIKKVHFALKSAKIRNNNNGIVSNINIYFKIKTP